jgi:YVTN family beta-propeller protein
MSTRVKSGRMRVLADCLSMIVMAALAATAPGCVPIDGRTTAPESSKDPSGADRESSRGTTLELKKTPAAETISRRYVRAGTAIEVQFVTGIAREGRPANTLRAGDDVTIRFRISDAATGRPITGAKPAAWLALRAEGEPRDLGSLTRKVAALARGDPLFPPELDLNQFYVVVLNDDATVTVVDPRFGFGGTRLLALVQLPGVGEDWVLSLDGDRLFVSIPSADRVVAIDTTGWKVVGSVELPHPTRLVLQADGHYLWAASGAPGGAGGIAAIDHGTLQIVARIDTGIGPHDVAIGRDDLRVFVTNRGSGTLTVVDARRLTRLADVVAGTAPVAVAYSSASRAAYVVDGESGVVSVIAADPPSVVKRLAVGAGVRTIGFAPDGRLGFLARQAANEVVVIDASLDQIVRRVKTDADPDQVAFTDRIGYVHQAGSPMLRLIPLDGIAAAGQAAPVIDVPIGRSPPGRSLILASAVARASAEDAVLIANPADQAIYYYKEGLSAPQGSFRGYGHVPHAVLSVDRSLRPAEPGTYVTVARLRRPGHFDLAFFLDSPRLVHCFEFDVASDPHEPSPPAVLDVELVGEEKAIVAGQSNWLRLRLVDRGTRRATAAPAEFRLLATLPGRWQRFLPTEAEPEAGIYAFDFTPPRKGLYLLYVESPSASLAIKIPTVLQLEVQETSR